MIKHVVCWKLYEEALGRTKDENARVIKDRLLKLKSLIPQIQSIEVGVNFEEADDNNYDVVLIAEYENMEDLRIYQKHPEHQAFVKFINPLRSHKIAVDFEKDK